MSEEEEYEKNKHGISNSLGNGTYKKEFKKEN